ncbi:PilN domain-containing protein [Shewanella aestuarii]|uniref:Uncharacterized protein n=1 Tax=Shewanella aestuarii TaxID=1028752 RepID=A0A6G9QLZ9_9GAMM|nr:PilN domain-containing protein [Shewanella aestuarii]QIR15143.1 hypothetical protein HBH39_12145 [Shewanella aestuarii]
MKLNLFNKLLSRFAYVSNTVQTIIVETDNKQISFSDVDSKQALFVVLGRQHYSENHYIYPIADGKEAIKAAKFELDNNDALQFFNSYPLDEQSCSVSVWTVDKNTIELMCNNALFVVPESYILAKRESLVKLQSANKPNIFIAHSRKGPVSYIADDFVVDEESFCQLAEIAMPDYVSVINEENLAKSLIKGAKETLATSFFRFFVGTRASSKAKSIPYLRILLTFFSVITLYNVLFSGFLVFQETSVSKKFEENKSQVEIALNAQNDLKNQLELNQILLNQIIVDDTPWNAFDVLAMAINSGMQITNVSFQSGQYRITGVADKATVILSALSSHPSVAEANFSGAVRESRTGERFSISFKTKVV